MEKVIHNVETGEITQEDFTAEDVAAFELMQEKEATMAADAASKTSEKSALLERLGITAEEANLLLS